MCRNGGEARRRLAGPALAALVALSPAVASTAEISAASEEAHAAAFELSPSTRVLLSRLQGHWLEWLSALNRGEEQPMAEAAERLLAYSAQIGIERLPELSTAAAAKAVQEARAGKRVQAAWALETAERLDPGRPETSFAAFAVERASERYGHSLLALARAAQRTLAQARLREIALHSLAVWLYTALLLATLLFVAVGAVLRGMPIYRDLSSWLGRRLPSPWSHLVAVAFLLWPLAMADGPFWLALHWSILLWLYGSRIERAVVALAWVLLAAAPLLLFEQQRRLRVALLPEVQAIEALAESRLEGNLLTHVAALRHQLPDSVAARHLEADLHRRLGQCDLATPLYGEVLAAEPENPEALADLGVCAFDGGAFDRAIELFQRAAAAGRPRAGIHFNLSQSFAELYRFREGEGELRRARQVDAERVNQWMRERDPRAVVSLDGGLERVPEIREELLERWRGDQPEPVWIGHLDGAAAVPMTAVLIVLGLGYRSLLRVRGRGSSPPGGRWLRGAGDVWRRVVLPGVAEAEEGEWGRAFAVLLVVAALLTLLRIGDLGFAIPWGFAGALPAARWLAVAGLLYLVIARWREQNGGLF